MSSFDPVAYAREVEAEGVEGDWTVHRLGHTPNFARPWLTRRAPVGPNAPRLYISTGIHGDEVSGPLAVLAMLREPDFFAAVDVTLFPLLNPEGLARGTRENAAGLDLNRDYRNPQSPEIRGHLEALENLGRFDAALMLHEDYEGIGAYLFELNDETFPHLGAAIVAAMGRHLPIDRREEIDEFPAREGIIRREEIVRLKGPIEDRPDWPEAFHLSQNHTHVAYTTETPKPFAPEARLQAQIAAVRTVIAALRNNRFEPLTADANPQ